MNFIIIGTYRSGSSLLAEMLHGLGLDLGAPFHGDFYEPEDLAEELRRWWREPELVESMPANERRRYLCDWMAGRRSVAGKSLASMSSRSAIVGAKHPLLTLSAVDVMQSWGQDTLVVWTDRLVDQSIESLQKLGWFPNPASMQRRLHTAASDFFDPQRHLRVDYQDVLKDPQTQWRRVVDYFQLKVSHAQMSKAVELVRRSPTS